jgi:amino acid adenylation domain-containing protein
MPAPLFARMATVPREQPAVIDSGRQVSFGQLEEQVGRLGLILRDLRVGPETVVAICLPRSVALVTGMLAVLKVGGACLPLEADYPPERLIAIVRDCRPAYLITSPAIAASVSWPGDLRLVIADESGPVGRAGGTPVEPAGGEHPGSLAYIIYTSGSTGRPKGVEVTRGALAGLIAGLEQAGVIRPGVGRVGWNASVSFDASVKQWSRLFRGDTLVLIPPDVRTDPPALAGFAREHQLTDLDITPSHLALVLPHLQDGGPAPGANRPLRLLVGGEPISPALWSALRALESGGSVAAVNLYGPTECVVDSTACSISVCDLPCLGQALPDVRAYVLDESLRLVRGQEPGELYIGGVRLARGYRHRPGLTAERFLPDAAAGDGTRMYRTGDRVRRDAQGRLEYLGRLDDPVKVRGFRVELGEVESALRVTTGIIDAVVTLRDDLAGGPGLVAYCRTAGDIAAAVLRASLATRLPEFMVPAAFVMLDQFPLNANGKIDRAALPAPQARSTGRDEDRGAAARAAVAVIAAVWSDVLGVQDVGEDEDFFVAGGHSVLAIQVVARLKRQLNIRIPVSAVFANPRLGDLADYVEQVLGGASVEIRTSHGGADGESWNEPRPRPSGVTDD